MKLTTSQLVGLLALIGVGAFGITFIKQSVPNDPLTTPGQNAGTTVGPKIVFVSDPKVAEPTISELHTSGAHDFRFKNATDDAVEVGAESLSCKCQSMGVLTLTAEEEKIYVQSAGVGAWMRAHAGALPLLCAQAAVHVAGDVGQWKFVGDERRWQEIHPPDTKLGLAEKTTRVPAARSGLFRLSWDGKRSKFGPELLKATLWIRQPPGNLRSQSLLEAMELPVYFVPPMGVNPTTLTLPTPLSEGTRATVSFVCWSTVRPHLKVSARERGEDPCFECTLTPLPVEECRKLLTKEAADAPMVTAYRVDVTVHETRNGKHLELGPFFRHIDIMDDGLATPLTVEINGRVVGDVRVLTKSQRVDLMEFDVSRGVSDPGVTLESDRANMKLSVASVFPEYLNVELKEAKEPGLAEGKKHWLLKVSIPPNRAEGKLPRESAVTLTISDKPPRAIRIPVTGHATFNR